MFPENSKNDGINPYFLEKSWNNLAKLWFYYVTMFFPDFSKIFPWFPHHKPIKTAEVDETRPRNQGASLTAWELVPWAGGSLGENPGKMETFQCFSQKKWWRSKLWEHFGKMLGKFWWTLEDLWKILRNLRWTWEFPVELNVDCLVFSGDFIGDFDCADLEI